MRKNLLKHYYKCYGSIQNFHLTKSKSIYSYGCLIKYKVYSEAVIHLGMNSEVKIKQKVPTYMGHQMLLTWAIPTVLLTQYLANLTDIWVKYSPRFLCSYVPSTDDDKLPEITLAIWLCSVHVWHRIKDKILKIAVLMWYHYTNHERICHQNYLSLSFIARIPNSKLKFCLFYLVMGHDYSYFLQKRYFYGTL